MIESNHTSPTVKNAQYIVRSGRVSTLKAKHTHTILGFTLIELIVSLGIFSIVMLIATGSYLSAVSTTRNVQKSTKVANTLATALSTISNEIRNGSCKVGQCKVGASNTFSFTNSSGVDITYCLVTTGVDKGIIKRAQGNTICSSSPDSITNSSVKVTNLSFWSNSYSVLSGGITGEQYWINISLLWKPSVVEKDVPPIYLETGVTFRQLTIR